jgi:hypothetical protein
MKNVHLFNSKIVKDWHDFDHFLKIVIKLILELISSLLDDEDENGLVNSCNDNLRRYIFKAKQQWFKVGKIQFYDIENL